MESVQTKAGVKIFKLNAKTNSYAVRAPMHAPLIARRCEIARLKHYAKVKTMEKDKVARVHAPAKGQQKLPPMDRRFRMNEFIDDKENKEHMARRRLLSSKPPKHATKASSLTTSTPPSTTSSTSLL
jgi:hypothetical protein